MVERPICRRLKAIGSMGAGDISHIRYLLDWVFFLRGLRYFSGTYLLRQMFFTRAMHMKTTTKYALEINDLAANTRRQFDTTGRPLTIVNMGGRSIFFDEAQYLVLAQNLGAGPHVSTEGADRAAGR